MYYAWGRREIHIGFWWRNQKERDRWEDLDIGEDNIKMDLR
jgi:hypothetical protein